MNLLKEEILASCGIINESAPGSVVDRIVKNIKNNNSNDSLLNMIADEALGKASNFPIGGGRTLDMNRPSEIEKYIDMMMTELKQTPNLDKDVITRATNTINGIRERLKKAVRGEKNQEVQTVTKHKIKNQSPNFHGWGY